MSLTACSSDSSGGDPGGAQTEQQPPGNVDVDINGGLPAEFPADVPLVDGEIVTAGGTEEEGVWIVVIRSTDSPEDARTAAIDLLTAAGYTESDDISGMGVYTNGAYTIVVRAGEQNGDTILNYSIATKS